MAANAKPAAESAPQSAYNSIAGLLGDWIRQGTEGFVATQKILLDLAAQQNALALTILRERIGFSTPASKKLADFAGQGIKTLMEVQRQMLDVAARQNSILSEGLKPGLADTPINCLAEVVHQGLDNFITAQKQLLNIIQTHAEGAVNDFGEGKRFETGRLAELAREGTRNFLESQKKFLDIVEEQLTTKKEPAAEKAENGKGSVDIFDMAKKSVDSLIEAQQRLLDLASDQVKANAEFARDVFSTEVRPTTISEVMKKSVDSFVAAQKALLDLASKPRKAETPGDEPGQPVAA
jgi:hypothetical protein